jgi:hypothetical protein
MSDHGLRREIFLPASMTSVRVGPKRRPVPIPLPRIRPALQEFTYSADGTVNYIRHATIDWVL